MPFEETAVGEHLTTFVIKSDGDGVLSPALFAALDESLRVFDRNPSLRVFALIGNDRQSLSSTNKDEHLAARQWRPLHRASKPVIAAVSGSCTGLGLVILGSITDMRIAGEGARFGFGAPSTRVSGNWALASRLHSQVPYAPLMQLLLTGETIDSAEALRIGLVNEVVPDGETTLRALAVAQSIAEIAPAAIRADTLGVRRAPDWAFEDALFLGSAFATLNRLGPDTKEGVDAFLEKRKPRFKGM